MFYLLVTHASNSFMLGVLMAILSFSGIGTTGSALADDGILDIDVTISLETTWHNMEDLVSAGLVKSIGIRFQLYIFNLTAWGP